MNSEPNNNNNKTTIRRTDWRKHVKKIRRKRIRQSLAKHRDEQLKKEQLKKLKDPKYLTWLAEMETNKLIRETEEEERLRDETNEKWLRYDLLCQQRFNIKKQKLNAIERVKEEQRLKIKQEFEAEQKRLDDLKEEEKRVAQEKQDEFNRVMLRIDDYINWKCDEPPMELERTSETNPGRELCKFFFKTGTCRFGRACSRNHRHPGISNILLIVNFFTHIRLEQNQSNEYGNDSYLEYDESDLYGQFNEFANDVLTEFEKCGKICQFLVCDNQESHLRGNVYIEYDSKRDALKAYRIFHGRFYGGRTLNVEFCSITSWRNAICGLSLTKRCPKGRNCNFLHAFKNPMNRYPMLLDKRKDKHQFNSQRAATSIESSKELNKNETFLSERLNRNIGWDDDGDYDDFDSKNKCNRKWSSNESDSDKELDKNKQSNFNSALVRKYTDNDVSKEETKSRRQSNNDLDSNRRSRSRSHKSNVSRSKRENSKSVRKRSRSRDKRSKSRDNCNRSRDKRSKSPDKRSKSGDKHRRSHEKHTDKKKKKRDKRKDSRSKSDNDSRRDDSKDCNRNRNKTKRKKKD